MLSGRAHRYDVYADEAHCSADVLASAKLLGYDEWLQLCLDFALVDDEFTQREGAISILALDVAPTIHSRPNAH